MRLTTFGKILCGIAICVMQSAAANGAMLLTDDFDYVGALTSNGWTAHSGAGAKVIMSDGTNATVVQSAGSGEDVNRNTGEVMGAGDKWYAGFDVAVTGTGAAVATSTYFAHFLEGTSTFESRLFVTAPAGGGNYRLAFSNSSTIASTWASDFTFGDTHRVVMAYDYTSGASTLWVDPVNEASTSISGPALFSDEITSFALRQNTGGDSSQLIGNLFVATSFNEALSGIPEPASLVLVGLAGLALVGVARRRS